MGHGEGRVALGLTQLNQTPVLLPRAPGLGQMEQMQSHWESLQRRLRRERLPDLGAIPSKNVRRGDKRDDLRELFSDPGLVRLVVDRYGDDISTFYSRSSVQELISGDPLTPASPIESIAACQLF